MLSELRIDAVQVREWCAAMHLLPGVSSAMSYELEQVRVRLAGLDAIGRERWAERQRAILEEDATGLRMSPAQQERLKKILALGAKTPMGQMLQACGLLADVRLSWLIEANSRPPTTEALS